MRRQSFRGLLSTLLFAASVSHAPAAVATEPLSVVILGDSLTAGFGLEEEEAFPALLDERFKRENLPVRVVNAGLSGDTTSGGLRRLSWIMKQRCDVLLIALGGNDGLRGVPTAVTEDNLRSIIKQARTKSPGVEIVLAGMKVPPNLGASYTDGFEELFPRVAREENVTLIPFLLEGVGGERRLNQPDGIHPTAEGQRMIAETVYRSLLPVVQEVLARHPATADRTAGGA